MSKALKKNHLRQTVTILSVLCFLFCQPAFAKINYLASLTNWSKSCRQLTQPTNKHWAHHQLLRKRWVALCKQWKHRPPRTQHAAKKFFQHHFSAHKLVNQGALITGYYAPMMHACWFKQPGCQSPIYGQPHNKQLRSLSRHAINEKKSELFPVIAWTDPVDRYFLQIQGSGILTFSSGEHLYLGYAGKNHQPYSSIGRLLYQKGKIHKNELSMQGIKHYLRSHLKKEKTILETNASFIFFKTKKHKAVIGKLGSPLHAQLSAAIDNHSVPLGSLIMVNTTDPVEHHPWNLLLVAQDSGSAIRTTKHIDVYMGAGNKAADWAGKMHQTGRITYFLPNKLTEITLPKNIEQALLG